MFVKLIVEVYCVVLGILGVFFNVYFILIGILKLFRIWKFCNIVLYVVGYIGVVVL